MLYLLNAFPNSFLPQPGSNLLIQGISEEEARALLTSDWCSAVGHNSFADVLSARLGIQIPVNRITVSPEQGDTVLIAAVQPPRRLPEGEVWTQTEILSMEIKYCLVQF